MCGVTISAFVGFAVLCVVMPVCELVVYWQVSGLLDVGIRFL